MIKPKGMRIINLLIVWLFLSIAHFSLYSTATFRKMTTFRDLEFEKIQESTNPSSPNASHPNSFRIEHRVRELLEHVLSLPLIPTLYPHSTESPEYFALTIPLSVRFLNSALAGIFLHLFAFVLVLVFPQQSKTRVFIEGRFNMHEEGTVPKVFNRIPFFATARILEVSQHSRYGKILVFGFFHCAATTIITFLSIAEKLDPGSFPIGKLLVRMMRFPLTPLAVDDHFWETAQTQGWLPLIIMVANGLLCGSLLALLISIIKLPWKTEQKQIK